MLTMTSVACARVRGECCGVVVVWCVWRGGGGGGKVACSLPRFVVAQWLIKAVGRSADPVLGPRWRPRGDPGHGASLFPPLFSSLFVSFFFLFLVSFFLCSSILSSACVVGIPARLSHVTTRQGIDPLVGGRAPCRCLTPTPLLCVPSMTDWYERSRANVSCSCSCSSSFQIVWCST